MDAFVTHRLNKLEEQSSALEGRVRALELGYAKMLGWSAGGAAVGALAFQIILYLMGK
jgi:hypothetical protein